jgi:hypothetical protein
MGGNRGEMMRTRFIREALSRMIKPFGEFCTRDAAFKVTRKRGR